MLLSLKVSQLATIAYLEIDFYRGFTILTGETGAGKSIIIDAVNLLLGEKADISLIRAGATSASVEASFDIQHLPQLKAILAESAIPYEEELLIRGILSPHGKKQLFLNDIRVSRNKLSEVGRCLIHVHGQHDNQTLLQSDSHVHFLDGFGQTVTLCRQVTESFQRYQQHLKRQRQLQQQLAERHQRVAYLRFQQEEIQQAQLSIEEEAILHQEARVLGHAESLSQLSQSAQTLLYEGDANLLSGCYQLQGICEQIRKIDSPTQSFLHLLESAKIQLDELFNEISLYQSRIHHDPQRLESIHQRLETIQKLKRKYGKTVEEVLQHLENVETELEDLEGLETEEQQISQELGVFHEELHQRSHELSAKRHQAAETFDHQVTQELRQMGMERALFKTKIVVDSEELNPYTPQGIDRVEFLLSVNPGHPLRSLVKVASGGELSRVMLALKTVLASIDSTETLIFDEIDTGISGRIAEIVGSKLRQLGQSRQILCITHLPQIAAFAENHLKITKTIQDQQTYTTIHGLSSEEQVEEVARLMGGSKITEKTMNLAREMRESFGI